MIGLGEAEPTGTTFPRLLRGPGLHVPAAPGAALEDSTSQSAAGGPTGSCPLHLAPARGWALSRRRKRLCGQVGRWVRRRGALWHGDLGPGPWVPRDNQKCLKGAGNWGRGRDQEARKGAQLHCANGLRGGSRGGGLGKRLGKRGRGPAAVASTPGPAATLPVPSGAAECPGRAPSGPGCPSGSASGSSKSSGSCPSRFPAPRIGSYEVVAP